MKIAMIGGRGLPDTYSGVEVFLKELCPRLVSKGHEVTVYCMPNYFSVHHYKGINLVKVPSIRTRHFSIITHSLMSCIHALRSQADIYHFNAIGPSVLSFFPRLFGFPSLATMHSLNWRHSKWNIVEKKAIKLIERFAVFTPNIVVAVAKQHQAYLNTKYGKNVYHIPNGVNVFPIAAAEKILDLELVPDGYILYVGRLSPEKGIHFLINAFNRIKTNKKLVIAGGSQNDNYIKSLKNLANDLVLFLGHVTSSDLLSELYSNASIYVLPSESEGLSISLIEAMSYGCCVVTSAIKENIDVILDCGLSFESGNEIMLSKILNVLLQDPLMRKIMGQKAKKRAHKFFNWDDICAKYDNLYKNMHNHIE
jgi:glycosyltransferase involved in cell wall biosynthesis